MNASYQLKWVLVISAFLAAHPSGAQATFKQSRFMWNSGTSAGGNSPSLSQTCTFSSPSTTGDLIVVHVTYSSQTRSVSTVTDTKLNTYHKIIGRTSWGSNYSSELWYAFNITGGGGAITTTVTLSGTGSLETASGLQFIEISLTEFSGMPTSDPYDKNSSASGTTAAAFNTGSATVTATHELIYGAAVGGTMGTINKGSTFTQANNSFSNMIEYKSVTAVGSYSADFSPASGGTYVAQMATFRTNTSLPIRLETFTASATPEGTVALQWTTATETNNDYFEIERSHDGIHWSDLKNVDGAGNSFMPLHYSALDEDPFTGYNYYRLRQVDFDGQSTRSSAVVSFVETSVAKQEDVYPNPASDWITVKADAHVPPKIFNHVGEDMSAKISGISLTDSGMRMNIQSFPPGIYVLKTNRASFRIIKM